jgi:hypothetical protein
MKITLNLKIRMSGGLLVLWTVLSAPLSASSANSALSKGTVEELKKTLKAREAKPKIAMPASSTNGKPQKPTRAVPPAPVEKSVASHKVHTVGEQKVGQEKSSKIASATAKHLMDKIRNMSFKHIKSTLFLIQEMSGLTEQQKEAMWLEHEKTVKQSGLKNINAEKLKKEYLASLHDNWHLTPEQKAQVGSAYIAKVKALLKAEATKPSYKELVAMKLGGLGSYIKDIIEINSNPLINTQLLNEDVAEIERLLK